MILNTRHNLLPNKYNKSIYYTEQIPKLQGFLTDLTVNILLTTLTPL